MKRNRHLFLPVLVLGIMCCYCQAQNGKINIQQDEKIATLLRIYKSVNENTDYYRIQVGFGTYDQAQKLQMEVTEDFPELPSKIDFDSPTYRVRVGRFKNKLDADRKFFRFGRNIPTPCC
ncbi:MAG: SPOR domain-containing protein [Bacteroidota bacterium]